MYSAMTESTMKNIHTVPDNDLKLAENLITVLKTLRPMAIISDNIHNPATENEHPESNGTL